MKRSKICAPDVQARLNDEHCLSLVLCRSQGLGPKVIGEIIGTTSKYVSTLCNRIRNADLDESGENRMEVLKHYWR